MMPVFLVSDFGRSPLPGQLQNGVTPDRRFRRDCRPLVPGAVLAHPTWVRIDRIPAARGWEPVKHLASRQFAKVPDRCRSGTKVDAQPPCQRRMDECGA